MDINTLKQCLKPWMQADTWESGHPLDEARFHRSLHSAFSRLGNSIHAEYFEEAMTSLLNELYPPVRPVDQSERLRPFILEAEHISSYLSNTENV